MSSRMRRTCSTGRRAGSGEVPVEVALAGVDRAGVPAAHGDHHVRGMDHVVGERLGELLRQIEADFGHHRHNGGIDLVGGGGTGGARTRTRPAL